MFNVKQNSYLLAVALSPDKPASASIVNNFVAGLAALGAVGKLAAAHREAGTLSDYGNLRISTLKFNPLRFI